MTLYIIYLLITFPWVMWLCHLIDKYYDYCEKEWAAGEKHPVIKYIKSIPRRHYDFMINLGEATWYGQNGRW